MSRTTLWLRALELGITAMTEISNLELGAVVERISRDAPRWYNHGVGSTEEPGN